MTKLPDYKANWPKWTRRSLNKYIGLLDQKGLDMLEAMLRYNPATRVSAKAALEMPYFTDILDHSDSEEVQSERISTSRVSVRA